MKKNCESCLMPLSQDPNPELRDTEQYCSLCHRSGAFTYEGDLKGFQKVCYDGMREMNMNPVTAWVLSRIVRFAPRWRNR